MTLYIGHYITDTDVRTHNLKSLGLRMGWEGNYILGNLSFIETYHLVERTCKTLKFVCCDSELFSAVGTLYYRNNWIYMLYIEIYTKKYFHMCVYTYI